MAYQGRWDPHRSRSWVSALEFTMETTTNFDGKLMKIVTLILCLNIKGKKMMQKEKVRKSETKRINIVMDVLCPQWKV